MVSHVVQSTWPPPLGREMCDPSSQEYKLDNSAADVTAADWPRNLVCVYVNGITVVKDCFEQWYELTQN